MKLTPGQLRKIINEEVQKIVETPGYFRLDDENLADDPQVSDCVRELAELLASSNRPRTRDDAPEVLVQKIEKAIFVAVEELVKSI